MKEYAHPEVLVSTAWMDQHKDQPDIRIVEVDIDTWSYHQGHIPNAIGWNWRSQLCDTVCRDLISKIDFERLMADSGIGNDTMVILYGNNSNWFATWAAWQMKVYGHKDVRLVNGGRKKWVEERRELTHQQPSVATRSYTAREPDFSLRALLPEVQRAVEDRSAEIVDVRTLEEFTGELLAPPGLPETCQRGGHIPGARNVPQFHTCREDGTFKSADELERLYRHKGITADKSIIAHCRIGERASHTWFILKYLLGYPNVKLYDGSWTEWGNLVRAPIERGA